VLAKLAIVVPEPLQAHLVSAPIYVSDGDAPATGTDPAELRHAIHEARKVAITYIDEAGRRTHRTIRPVAMAYYVDVTLLGAWCELRNDFRNFRVDRILGAELLDQRFLAESGKLLAEWLALPKHRPDATGVEPKQPVSRAAAR
jgi:predicted DNA-binding transcriptional regulator YafY